ncbi:MAG: peptide chain release factor N(5)-glutamine methyltransferase, partial [Planctomycetota bacterium]|nr:peptide chain release factor N(5)-glutamine methyltransferase [Planctomycetota bacterium]
DDAPWTTRRLLSWIRTHLESRKIDSPRICAELLVSAAIGAERLRLYMEPDRLASEEERSTLREWVRRASAHEPVQYLVGEAWFHGHRFEVDSSTLIPRPSTETLVEVSAELLQDVSPTGLRVLEPCTGTGCAGLALLRLLDRPHRAAARMREVDEAILADVERLSAAMDGASDAPDDAPEPAGEPSEPVIGTLPGESASVVATDLVPAAVALATRNAAAMTLGDRFDARVGSLYEPLREAERGSFDLILANPPYISDAEFARSPLNVREHEPATALRGGVDGLDVMRPLVADAPRWLRPGGVLAVEAQYDQADAVRGLMETAGFREISVRRDLDDHERVIVGRLPQ